MKRNNNLLNVLDLSPSFFKKIIYRLTLKMNSTTNLELTYRLFFSHPKNLGSDHHETIFKIYQEKKISVFSTLKEFFFHKLDIISSYLAL